MKELLDGFSVERLEALIDDEDARVSVREQEALARIALAVKQAQPIAVDPNLKDADIDALKAAFEKGMERYSGAMIRLAATQPAAQESAFKAAFDIWQEKTDWVQKDRRFDVLLPWGKHRADVLREYIELLEAQLNATAPAVPHGWKLVPVEPTEAMCKAAFEASDKWPSAHCDNWREQYYSFAQPRYKAMLDASPAPEAS